MSKTFNLSKTSKLQNLNVINAAIKHIRLFYGIQIYRRTYITFHTRIYHNYCKPKLSKQRRNVSTYDCMCDSVFICENYTHNVCHIQNETIICGESDDVP